MATTTMATRATMYGVLRTYEVREDQSAALLGQLARELEPTTRELDGFVSSRVTDLGRGVVLWLIAFEDAGSAAASLRSMEDWVGHVNSPDFTPPSSVLIGKIHRRAASRDFLARRREYAAA